MSRKRFIRRGYLRNLLLITVIILGKESELAFWLGNAIFGCGVLLHFWSAGSLPRGYKLSKSGPYSLLRHPFYLANAIIDLGICIMGAHPVFPICYAPFFYIAYKNTIKLEEEKLKVLYKDEYLDYLKKVKAFLPSLPGKELFKGFSIKWLLVNKEIPRVLRFLTYPILIVLGNKISLDNPLESFLENIPLIGFCILMWLASFILQKLLQRASSLAS